MNINKATLFFESLVSESTKKSDIKVYEKFLHILNGLKFREFSKDDIQSIEAELESLNLSSSPSNKKRYFSKRLSQFETYIKETYFLTTKNYYTNKGIALGMSFGMFFGVIFLSHLERSLDVSLGILLGMVVGLSIGRYMDKQARDQGNVL